MRGSIRAAVSMKVDESGCCGKWQRRFVPFAEAAAFLKKTQWRLPPRKQAKLRTSSGPRL